MILAVFLPACEGAAVNTAAPVNTPVGAAAAVVSATPIETESAPKPNQELFTIEKYTASKVNAEYIAVSGLSDTNLQETLNSALSEFFLGEWQEGNAVPDSGTYETKARYYNIKGKYLSVVRVLSYMPEGGAYPTDTISARTFDLTTGADAGALVFAGGMFNPAHPSDVFRQVYPEIEFEDIWEKLNDYMQANDVVENFYLTETGVSVFINNDLHAQGDYFVFEAAYSDIVSMLGGSLAELVAGGSGAAAGSIENEYKYGITVNIPDSWKNGSYELTATENPEIWYDIGYPILYRVHCDYLYGEGKYSLFSLYVFNAVDWNEIALAVGDGVPFGQLVKMDDKFAYAAADFPQENPFEAGSKKYDEFASMDILLTGGADQLFTIAPASEAPTSTVSKNETVESFYSYFSLNIPTNWNIQDLDIQYQGWDVELLGYEGVIRVTYLLKTGRGETAELFTAYVFENNIWKQAEADADGGVPIAEKIAANNEYTLAVTLPQENPLDPGSDIGKKFDEMQIRIRDFDKFFQIY